MGDTRKASNNLVEKLQKRPLGKYRRRRRKNDIKMKIYKTEYFYIFRFELPLFIIKMTVTVDHYLEQPRKNTHSNTETDVLMEINGEIEHKNCIEF
jgi:hypothetical protein